MHGWGWDNQQQYIFEAEIMPYAVSLVLWQENLKGKCLFAFIDNEGTRAAWICGFAGTKAAQHMLPIGTTVEAKLSIPLISPEFRLIQIWGMPHLVENFL